MLSLKSNNGPTLYMHKVDREYSLKLGPRKEGEKISILRDTMFKTMFQNNNRLKYSCQFISYYLDISYEELLKSMRLVKNDIDKKRNKDKGERCDFVAEINGSIINIEVNNNSNEYIMERNMEYAYRLYGSKVKEGSKLEYRQVIQFNLNNFAFKDNNKIIDEYVMQNKEGLKLNNKLIIVQIYVPNLRKKWYTQGIDSLSDDERYLLTLIEPSIEVSKELGKGNNIMEEYVDEASEASLDFNIGESYDHIQADIEQAKQDGIEEGRIETNIEHAKTLKQHNVPIDVITITTGLTIDEVNNL